MKAKVALLFFISSLAHAVDSIDAVSINADYCKVPYIDKMDGRLGTYRGQCNDEKPHGSGTVTYHNGDKLAGVFKGGVLEGNGTHILSDGSHYKGGWENGQRHGWGAYTWARGSSYIGEWVDDKRHGKGVFTWSNGNRFEGEFRNNKRYNGKYYTRNGRVYKCRLGQCR
ncbi:MAG: hypothetical protein V3T17_07610 [Pseudomonadales bacterium]